MSTFDIPNKICDKLDSLARRFWWKPSQREGRIIASRSWENLCCPRSIGGLGFKKAKNINSALLAKLAQMIASKRDSLCMRILRAKYKVKEDWLRADASKYASPTRKAIEKTRSVVKKGACFLIRDGESVNMWLDPWVPWVQSFIPSPKVESLVQSPMTVAHLIHHELHTWKTSLVLNIFNTYSAQAILSIPLPSRPRLDKLIWIPESIGCFSVKSAYKELIPNPPVQVQSDVNWSKIWKIRGSERLKMFLWRVVVNALPTRENLMCRMDIPDPSCVLCNQGVESAIHLFSRCQAAKALWFAACWGFKPDNGHFSSSSDIIKATLDPPSALCQSQDLWKVTLNMALTLEEIWHTRNEVLHLASPADINAACLRINSKFKEYSRVLSPCETPHLSKDSVKWAPPPAGTVKLNVDAAISQSKAALAVIARNESGVVLKVWAKSIPLCSPPFAEIEAILWALIIANRENWRYIAVESDSKISIDDILDPSGSPVWAISTCVFNICQLAKSFSSCLFSWINRSGNAATHVTAKYALNYLGSLCFVPGNLPAALAVVCEEDALACLSFCF